ncbi:MAG: phosphoribosylformylglycinamidine cyclo-ligase [Pseudomonadales bacterium]
MSITYKDAGVDIEKGDALVEQIKLKVKSTYGERVRSGVGGFACLYEVGDRLLAAGTDGVGTKLKLAQTLDTHNTIGIDLVAMCVNDILCTGATPLFFMDYLATGKLDVDTAGHILDGVVEGCLQSESALIGGETAEMPGMYPDGEYDLAGFAVGEVKPADVLDGSRVAEGDVLIGLPSSGFHSNGYSLVRKLVKDDETELMKAVLTPTRIYWKAVKGLLEKKLLNGLSHITGGGLLNIPRINEGFAYQIDSLAFMEQAPAFMREIAERAHIDHKELFRTFNMGVGLVCIVSADKREEVLAELKTKGEEPLVIGHVIAGSGEVYLPDGTQV